MPIYEYQCAECGLRIERLQGLHDPPPSACEACGGAMKRAVSAPAFQFKGTGWYVTDYAGRKGSDGAGKGSDGEGKGSDGDGKGSDSGGDAPAAADKAGKPKAADGGKKAAPAAAASTASSGD